MSWPITTDEISKAVDARVAVRAKADAILVGEAVMKAPDVPAKVRELAEA